MAARGGRQQAGARGAGRAGPPAAGRGRGQAAGQASASARCQVRGAARGRREGITLGATGIVASGLCWLVVGIYVAPLNFHRIHLGTIPGFAGD